MTIPFPPAGRQVEHAYAELDLAAGGGTLQQQNALGDPRLLARPWDPATCVNPQLRAEIWQWLEQVVTWLNHEYVWEPDAMISSCWPRYPHLVHELAVIADLRRRAGFALNSAIIEEWHRYALPAFMDRMRQRLRQHCQNGGHQTRPGLGRQTRQVADEVAGGRATTYRSDIDDLAPSSEGTVVAAFGDKRMRGLVTTTRPRGVHLVDGRQGHMDTDELLD